METIKFHTESIKTVKIIDDPKISLQEKSFYSIYNNDQNITN
jgi:hypothetical protein